jgi:hypothetical protein
MGAAKSELSVQIILHAKRGSCTGGNLWELKKHKVSSTAQNLDKKS